MTFKPSALVEAILNGAPSTAFLEETETLLDPAILAEVVQILRTTGKVPRDLATAVSSVLELVVDVCGTGGSAGHRLNTSTLTALLAPSLGIRVVKHGGRSASGKLGSLDLLEKWGLTLPSLFEQAAEGFRVTGLAYLPAGLTYGAFARYAPFRKTFGRPTLFNKLGPLLNPAGPKARLLGAWNPDVAHCLAHTLRLLGEEGMVVCAENGASHLDEASPFAATEVLWVRSGTVSRCVLPPLAELSAPLSELFTDAGEVALDLLEGEKSFQTDVACQLVAYNLALVSCLNGCPLESLPSLLAQRFQALLERFPAMVEQANARLHTLRNLQADHHSSPTKIEPLLQSGVESRGHGRRAFEPLLDANAGAGWLIAEVKLKTPTRLFPTFSLEERVEAYANADAVSVVTHPSFGGGTDLLRCVRSLTSKPILAKDFVRTCGEVEALASAGADGVLLLADMVDRPTLELLGAACVRCGVMPFVESSWATPTLSVDFVPMLNSRNLFSLQEAREYRDSVAFKVGQRPLVLASGAVSAFDVSLLRRQAGGIIVGTALMRLTSAVEISAYLAEARRTRPLLKACGAVAVEQAADALDGGADFVGVNLIPSSKRFVSHTSLREFEALSQKERLVFITNEFTPQAHLDFVAAWGEGWEQPYGLRRLHLPMLGAASAPYLAGTRLHLVESGVPGAGVSTPFEPPVESSRQKVLVAGGISPQNVRMRMAAAGRAGWHVMGVDAASGVALPGGRGLDGARVRELRSALDFEAE